MSSLKPLQLVKPKGVERCGSMVMKVGAILYRPSFYLGTFIKKRSRNTSGRVIFELKHPCFVTDSS